MVNKKRKIVGQKKYKPVIPKELFVEIKLVLDSNDYTRNSQFVFQSFLKMHLLMEAYTKFLASSGHKSQPENYTHIHKHTILLKIAGKGESPHLLSPTDPAYIKWG